MTSFNDAARAYVDRARQLRRMPFELQLPQGMLELRRRVDRFPYVPSDPRDLDARCYEAYNIQVHGLMKRLTSTGIEKIVIGVSGGLDSTQALLVAAHAIGPARSAARKHPRLFAAGLRDQRADARERTGAHARAARDGARDRHPPIRDADAARHRAPVRGTASRCTTSHSRTCRRASERRTSSASPISRRVVLGTGDLSELALGWATHGVGDQMSHYNVNASVPRTLIQYLIRWVAGGRHLSSRTGRRQSTGRSARTRGRRPG